MYGGVGTLYMIEYDNWSLTLSSSSTNYYNTNRDRETGGCGRKWQILRQD